MSAEDVTRILIDLFMQLPPEYRPWVGESLGTVAVTQVYWTPVVLLLLALMVVGSLRLYLETME